MRATSRGCVEAIRTLLRAGACVDTRDVFGNSALHVATRVANAEAMRTLLSDATANPNMVDANGMSPIHLAASIAGDAGAEVIAALLSDPRTDPSLADGSGGAALHIAAIFGNAGVVRALAADSRVDLDALAREEGMSALHFAVVHDRPLCMQALLRGSRVVDVNLRDAKLGRTALHIAADLGHSDAIAALLAHRGTDPNAVYKGITALHIAAIRDRLAALVHLITSPRVDVRATSDTGGYSVLHCAAQHGSVHMVRYLLGLAPDRIDVNARAGGGLTPLHVAAAKGRTDVIGALIADQRADLAVIDEAGSSLLHQAAHEGHAEAVAALLAHPRVVRDAAGRKDGHTPLHLAARLGHAAATAALLADSRGSEASVLSWPKALAHNSPLPPSRC